MEEVRADIERSVAGDFVEAYRCLDLITKYATEEREMSVKLATEIVTSLKTYIKDYEKMSIKTQTEDGAFTALEELSKQQSRDIKSLNDDVKQLTTENQKLKKLIGELQLDIENKKK